MAAPRGFDVIHSVTLAAPLASSSRSTLMVHDLAWREFPDAFPPRGRRWHEAALRRALDTADLLIAPSEETASALLSAGADPKRVEVIEEGCDHLPSPDTSATAHLLSRLGVRGPYLLSVGTLEPRKNLRRIVDAYAMARPRLPEPWPLVVVGPRGWGDEAEPAEPVAGVVLAGSVDDGVLSGLYAGARCLVYVPLAEGFGLPAVEAMAAGVPVVASPIPSSQGAALEVDPLRTASVAEGVIRAATDEATRSELVSAGLARAAGLTWEVAARRHVDLWGELGERPRGVARHPAAARKAQDRRQGLPVGAALPVSAGLSVSAG
ncbi:MAG: glycosyltransferase family 4 protein, partial [Mycobacterium sp.]